MPLARAVAEKKRGNKKAASEKRLTVDMVSLQRPRERMMRRRVAAKTCTLSGVETWWGLKGRYNISSDEREGSWCSARAYGCVSVSVYLYGVRRGKKEICCPIAAHDLARLLAHWRQ